MAIRNVIHAAHYALTASTVDIVNFSDAVYLVIIRNHGAYALYYRLAGGGGTATDPVVGGDDSYYCGAGETIAISRPVNQPVTQVKLISVGVLAYSVEGF